MQDDAGGVDDRGRGGAPEPAGFLDEACSDVVYGRGGRALGDRRSCAIEFLADEGQNGLPGVVLEQTGNVRVGEEAGRRWEGCGGRRSKRVLKGHSVAGTGPPNGGMAWDWPWRWVAYAAPRPL